MVNINKNLNNRLVAYISIIWGIVHSIFYTIGFIGFIYFLFIEEYVPKKYETSFFLILYIILNGVVHLQSCYYLWKKVKNKLRGFIKYNVLYTLLVGIYYLIFGIFFEFVDINFPYIILGVLDIVLLLGAITLTINGFVLLRMTK